MAIILALLTFFSTVPGVTIIALGVLITAICAAGSLCAPNRIFLAAACGVGGFLGSYLIRQYLVYGA